MSVETVALKMYMEKAAAKHLAQFNNLLENGITGGDQLWVKPGEHRALSALYGYLLGMQMESYNDEVNVLHQMQQKKQDLSIDKISSALLYIFRCGELVKLMKKSLVVDQKDPDKIPDKNYWKTMEDNLSQREEMLSGITSNLIHVLTNFAGENWQKRMPNVELCYEFYVVFWKAHANFK
jgi:hypothetical protein